MLKIREPAHLNIVETPKGLINLVLEHLENSSLSDEEKLGLICLAISGYEVGASLDRFASTGIGNKEILKCSKELYSKFREYSDKVKS